MPIYEYRCTVCGGGFEHLARAANDRPNTCPACGAGKIEKQFSVFSAAVGSALLKPCSEGACPAGATGGGCASAGRCPL